MPENTAQNRLIRNDAVAAGDAWRIVPVMQDSVAAMAGESTKAPGKPAPFRRTGEVDAGEEQIAAIKLPAEGPVIVPLSVWRRRHEALEVSGALEARLAAGELGIWLDTHEPVDWLRDSIDDINRLPLIAVRFERFADGRSYSMASLLRARHGYVNELRAFGDVLHDQLFFLRRCGFDSFQLRAGADARAALVALTALADGGDFSTPYQHAADGIPPLWVRRNAP